MALLFDLQKLFVADEILEDLNAEEGEM